MVRTTLALALGALALHVPRAHAAEITDIPPWLRGDISIDYGFEHEGGDLFEDDERVGSRTWEQHVLSYQGVFSAGPGVAVFFEIPQYLSARLAFPEANTMVYDPSSEQGTMADTESVEGLDPIKGKGVDGVWLGVKGTPFSEAFVKRGNRATWLLEAAFQTRSQSNFFTTDSDGLRGGGQGGGGTRLGMAFSTTRGVSQPYLAFRYTRTRPLEATFYDENGDTLVTGEEINPADHVWIRTGTEIVAHNNPEAFSRFSIDLRLGFGYATWQTMPSGLYLPSVLSTSRAYAATESEYTWASAGVGFYHQVFQYMSWKIVADTTYLAPHQIEHHYDVDTGDNTLDITVGAGIRVMIR